MCRPSLAEKLSSIKAQRSQSLAFVLSYLCWNGSRTEARLFHKYLYVIIFGVSRQHLPEFFFIFYIFRNVEQKLHFLYYLLLLIPPTVQD